MKTRTRRQGITLLHTGEGKGKSSSGFGVVFRAAGWGMRVCVIQYIKGKWKTGEHRAAARFPNIEWHALGDGFTWDTKNPAQDIKTSREIWQFSQDKILTQDYDLVMLDEINYCASYGWLNPQEIVDFVQQKKPKWMHLILTGRDAPAPLIQLATTATEMRKLKHAYDQKILAEQGVEF